MSDPLAVKRINPLKMMSPLIVFMLIATGWSAYWFHARSQAQDRFAQFESNTLALNCASRDWGGYPFRINLDCQAPQIDINGLTATADKLRLIMQAWNPNHLIGAVFGPVTLNGIRLQGDAIRFSHRNSRGTLARASMVAENQTMTLPDGATISIAKIDGQMKPAPDGGGAHAFVASALQLAMGDLQLDSVTLDGTVDENGNYELMSKPSEYLDAIWFAQRIANLNDDEMNAAQQIISPLLKDNDGKLPVIHKNGKWYWGPFRITR